MSQAWREFEMALQILAGPGTQRERLRRACGPTLVNLRKKELPAESQGDFELISVALLCGLGPIDRNALETSIGALDDAMVGQLIAAVVRIHSALAHYQPLPRPGSRYS